MPRGASDRRRRAGADTELLWGTHAVLEALRARRRRFVRLRVRAGPRRAGLAEVVAEAREAGVPVEELESPELVAWLPPEARAQGVALEAGPLPEVPLEELWEKTPSPGTLVALDGVEDPQNVGAIARVVEAAGGGGLILTRRHAPPLGPAVSRASAGAVEWLPTARVPNLPRALKLLKTKGFWIFGGDPAGGEDVFALSDRALRGDRVLVLGAEGRGLRPGIERVVDHRIRVPMAGRVASLNVAAAAAVVLFELARRGRLASSG